MCWDAKSDLFFAVLQYSATRERHTCKHNILTVINVISLNRQKYPGLARVMSLAQAARRCVEILQCPIKSCHPCGCFHILLKIIISQLSFVTGPCFLPLVVIFSIISKIVGLLGCVPSRTVNEKKCLKTVPLPC